ncbi:MAG: RHS repeat-associated core domain-containing protein [Clostridia bacterium]|nr:RHS repeat-associated core domain-containing protein [Clostridia bacterium]
MAIIIPPIIDDSIVEVTEVKRIENLAQPIKQYTAEGVAVNLNVYTGKPVIMHNDMCIGTGNYQIPVSHVYRDDLVGISAPVNIGFGDGWKLNLHQYVYPYQASYNYPRFSSTQDYVYIDDVGYKHRFVKYKTEDGFNVYYDADGTGLRLKLLADNECEVYNDVTRLHFDASGRLDKIISPFSNSLNKIITYDASGNIDKVYAQGKASRKLTFTHDANNRLTELKCDEHANKLVYSYNNLSKLTSVDLVNGNTSKNIATYVYNNIGKITLAYDAQKKQGVKLEYDVENQVSTVTTGFIDTETLDISALLHSDSYTYATGKNNTEVTNEKSITLVYNFDLNGRVCGTLEKETSGGLTNYRTLQKVNGWQLSETASSVDTEQINGKKVASPSETVLNVSDFIRDLGTDKYRYTDRFTLSFWLKALQDCTTPATAQLTVTTTDGVYNVTHTIKMRDLRKDAWRQVTIPVCFDKANENGVYPTLDVIAGRKSTMTGMSLSVIGAGTVQISDVRITPGAPAKIMVSGLEYKDQPIVYREHAGGPYTVLENDFVTESDLLTTYKNRFFRDDLDYFDFVYCNGTKVKRVVNAAFQKPNGDQSYFLVSNLGTTNFCIQSKTRTEENKWLVNETSYVIHDDTVCPYYEQKTSVGQVDNLTDSLSTDASHKYIYVDTKGKLLWQKDEYGVITKNNYNSYGNLTSVERYNEAEPNGEKIETTYTYDSTGELLTSISENGVTQWLSYVDAPFVQLEKVTTEDSPTTKYTYSADLTQLTKVVGMEKIPAIVKPGMDAMVGGTIDVERLRNNLTYNGESGRLNTVTDQAGRQYNFGYNYFGELTTYWRDTTKLEENIISRSSSNDVITEKRYRSTTPDIISTTLDKYGRVTGVKENSVEKIEFEYQTVAESPTCAQVNKITDNYANKTYNYDYDNVSGNLTSYTIADSATSEDFKIAQQTTDKQTKTTYTLGNQDIGSTTVYYTPEENGDQIRISPRITEVYSGKTSNGYDTVFIDTVYTYDKLGRVSEIARSIDSSNISNNITTIEYKDNDIKPETKTDVTYTEIGHNACSGFGFDEVVAYNENGNIYQTCHKKFDVEKNNNEELVKSNVVIQKTATYIYDSLDRLIEERNSALGDYKYDYNTYGNLTTIQKKNASGTYGVIKSFAYEDGRKKSINTVDEIDYDRYGNVISIGTESTYTYNPRGLLQTAQHVKDGITYTSSNTYNHQGVRCAKTVTATGGETISKTYLLDGNRIIGENWSDGTKLQYLYDAQGVCAIVYNGGRYNLCRGVDGSVLRIMAGNRVICEYDYDAWGNCEVHNRDIDDFYDDEPFIVQNNPFRWKGYYYDIETELYYCNYRYYSPLLCSWISPDSLDYLDPETVGGIDLYCYCNNNPVMYVDPSGHDWDWNTFWSGLFMVGTAIAAIALSVTTFGAGIPLAMSIVAGVTLGAGVLTGINGVATMIEAGTQYNFMRDGVFNGLGWSDSAYYIYAGVAEGVAIAGSMILGFYHTTGQYKAAKASQQYLGKGYTKAEKNRWISKDGYRQVRWDTTQHIYNGKPSPFHFNWYEYKYPIAKGVRNELVRDVHVCLRWFSYYI